MTQNENWRIWGRYEKYGELLFKRATGELEEMESSKALCKVIDSFYQKGMKLADVGCGAGHYLRSLRKRLDNDIDYTGFDATDHYIALAKKAFPQNANFKLGDILDLPCENDSFDIVMCNNVILHLPPEIRKPIKELIRISRKYIVIRTVFGKRNYIIKEISDHNDLDCKSSEIAAVANEETMVDFNYFNMYTEDYLRYVIQSIASNVDVRLIDDNMWESFDNTDFRRTGTKVLVDHQVSGNLLLDWKFIIISKL